MNESDTPLTDAEMPLSKVTVSREFAKKLERANAHLRAELDGLRAIMRIPGNACLVCGGIGGHEEGCMGTTTLVAMQSERDAALRSNEALREALEQIKAGKTAVVGLRPDYYAHASKIAEDALTLTDPALVAAAREEPIPTEGGDTPCAIKPGSAKINAPVVPTPKASDSTCPTAPSTEPSASNAAQEVQPLLAAATPTEVEQRVIAKIEQRREQGRKDYGCTMERTDLTDMEWLKHLQAELLDGAIYAEKLMATPTREELLAGLEKATTELEHCYNATEWPADGTSSQEITAKDCRALLSEAGKEAAQ